MNVNQNEWLVNPTNAYITKELHESAAGPGKGTEIQLKNWHDFYAYLLETPKVLTAKQLQNIEGKRRPLAKTLGGWSLTRYKNSHRKLENIIEIYALVIDLDHCTKTFDELCAIVKAQPYSAFVYTTLSNGCAGENKFRIIHPLSRAALASELEAWAFTLDKALDMYEARGCGPRDFSAVDAAHFWYDPACIDPADYSVAIIAGELMTLSQAPLGYVRPTKASRAVTERPPASTKATKENPISHLGFSDKYDLGWVHSQMAPYVSVGHGLRAQWQGAKYTTLAGLYASGSFVRELSEGTIHDAVMGYVMQNSGRTYKEEYDSLIRAWNKGKARPLESKKQASRERQTNVKVSPPGPSPKPLDASNELVLIMSGTNKVCKIVENFVRLLKASPIGQNLFYDEIKQRICVADTSARGYRDLREKADCAAINRWIGVTGNGVWPDIPSNQIFDMVDTLAKERPRNTFRDELQRTKWDGIPRVDTALVVYAKASDIELNRLHSKNLFLSLVERACSDTPTKVDTIVVLEGPQGCGKSRFVQAIGGEYYVAYSGKFTSERSTYLTLQGSLVAELSELAGMTKQDVESAKAFWTMSENVYEPKYLSVPVRVPRKFIGIGTTNKQMYLVDDTGNRRYNGVSVGKIDVQAFERDRSQILAEAHYRRTALDEKWWLQSDAHEELAREASQDREQEIPYFDLIRDTLSKVDMLTTTRIIETCLALDKQHWNKILTNQVADIMRKLGYMSKSVTQHGVSSRRWVSSDTKGLVEATVKSSDTSRVIDIVQ